MNKQPRDVITGIGHDGSTLVDGHRVGFNVAELIEYAFWFEDRYLLYVDLNPITQLAPDVVIEAPARVGIDLYLAAYDCVILGSLDDKYHAVAWSQEEQKCYNPAGGKLHGDWNPLALLVLTPLS